MEPMTPKHVGLGLTLHRGTHTPSNDLVNLFHGLSRVLHAPPEIMGVQEGNMTTSDKNLVYSFQHQCSIVGIRLITRK